MKQPSDNLLLWEWQGMGQAKLSEAFNARQATAAKELVN